MIRLELVHYEMQAAFKRCAILHRTARLGRRSLCTSAALQSRQHLPTHSRTRSISRGREDGGKTRELAGTGSVRASKGPHSRTTGTELVPQTPRPGTLQHTRRPDVPARVFPKANMIPDVELTPQERLRIEYETRKPPKPKQKPGILATHQTVGYTLD
jgi:hypothetical protein